MFPACERVHKALGDLTYDQAKKSKYFEWVDDIEKSIKNEVSDIFETLGVSADNETFNIVVKGFEKFQEYQLNKIYEIEKQYKSRKDLSEHIKSFVADWAPGIEFHYSQKYYLKNGPNPDVLRVAFQMIIEHFIPGCSYVADKLDSVDDKIKIASFSKDILQFEIDCLKEIKKNIMSLQNN